MFNDTSSNVLHYINCLHFADFHVVILELFDDISRLLSFVVFVFSLSLRCSASFVLHIVYQSNSICPSMSEL